jgi:hypothetical protein
VEVHERLVGPGSKQSVGLAGGCSAAAAGTRFPASGSSVRPSHGHASSSSAGGKARGDRVVTAISRARSSTVATMATAAGTRVLARGRTAPAFYSLLGVVRRFASGRLKPWHGMGSARRGDVQGWRPNGVRRRSRPAGACVARGADQEVYPRSAQSLKHGARTNGRKPASTCVYDGYGDGPTWPSAHAARATRRSRFSSRTKRGGLV